MTETTSAPSKQSSFVEVLAKYKELIGTIVFFLGGISFVFTYFATKEQLQQTRCLLRANVALIQGQMDISSLSQLSTKNLEESSTLEAKTSLSPAEIIRKNELKEAANEMALKMVTANTASAKALTKLKSGCID